MTASSTTPVGSAPSGVGPTGLSIETIREKYGTVHLFDVDHRSREVVWWPTHDALTDVIARASQHGPLPLIGTSAWLALDDGDPRRVGAIYAAASMFALHLECQATVAIEASHAVSASADWGAIARRNHNIAAWYAANPDLRRRPAC